MRKYYSYFLGILVFAIIATFGTKALVNDELQYVADSPSWFQFYGSSGDDEIWDLVRYEDYFYAVGTWSKNSGDDKLVLLKLDKRGNLVWKKTWKGYGYTAGYHLEVYNNHLYLGGRSGKPNVNALIQKYNLDGRLLWSQAWDGKKRRYEEVDGFVFVNNNIYVAVPSGSLFGKQDVAILKYSLDGNLIWAKYWDSGGNDMVNGIVSDGQYLYLAVRSPGIFLQKNNDAFLQKYDLEGNLLWSKSLKGNDYDDPLGIAIEGKYVYLVSFTKSFGKNMQIFVARFDKNSGDIQWQTVWGGAKNEAARSIIVKNGYSFIAGGTKSYGKGGEDVFLIIIGPNGNLIAEKFWGGKNDERAKNLIFTPQALYLVGVTSSYGNGSEDGFLIKWDFKQ